MKRFILFICIASTILTYAKEISAPFFLFFNKCEFSYTLTSIESQYNYVYRASEVIELTNNYYVSSSNGDISMKAGKSIVFSPNTHIDKGASFLAKIEPCCPQDITYEKFFTPNHDGVNDYWRIKWGDPNSFSEVYIFDRYGKLVKALVKYDDFWDGTYNGKPLPSTDYWFLTTFTDCNGNRIQLKSHFSLKR